MGMKKKRHAPTVCAKFCIALTTMLSMKTIVFGNVRITPNLVIAANTTYTVSENDTLIINSLDMENDAKFIINGILRFEDNGISSDFTMRSTPDTKSFFTNYAWNWKKNLYIENNGKIECRNFIQSFSTVNNMQATYKFYNNGAIECQGDFYSDWVDTYTTYQSSCNAKIEAQNITFQGRAGWTYNGVYKTNNFTLDITQGGNIVNIGSSCGDSKFEVGKLTLKNNVAQINVEELALLKSIDLTGTYTSVNLHVDGTLTEGYIAGYNKLLMNGSDNSTINLCFNPTDGMNFQENGTAFATKSNSTGTVIYLQNDIIANAWNSESSPKTEKDIQGMFREIGDRISTYEECINGFHLSTLLPIRLTSFTVHGSQEAINLEWEVATEKNIYYYDVEYSINGIDWYEIDHVEAMGTTSFTTQYNSTFTNDFPHGFVYFRLKQITLDSTESYSKTIVYDNSISNETFKALKVGPIDILYNNQERKYIKK